MLLPNEILIPMVGELVSKGKTVTLPLRGFSMRPYLENDRDKALLKAPPVQLRVGDVILAEIAPCPLSCQSPEQEPLRRWALHRIVAIEGDNITMYGDGNFSPEHILRKDVMAIAIGFYRKGSTRLDSVETWHYRLYWRTWIWLRPVRRYLLLLWELYQDPNDVVHRIIRKIKRIICK